MSLIILTKSPISSLISLENSKLITKRLFNRVRGPGAVVASFLRGLNELNISYLFNPSEKGIKNSDVVWVNESIDALSWAIKNKQQKKIKALYTGPNLVIAPPDAGGIIGSKEIDKLFFPSQWTKDFYGSFDGEFFKKIEICPAGVSIPKREITGDRNLVIIYNKKCSNTDLVKFIKSKLTRLQINFVEIIYGHFSQQNYFKLLNKSKAMIYLSDSESQGIALQEAWVRDVPTLVWNRGYMTYNNYRWYDEKMGAPYLVPTVGNFFQGKDDFEKSFLSFLEKLNFFMPNVYVLGNLTDVICTKKILKIINTNNYE